MKKFFTLFLAMMASITFANAAIIEGTCGENLTWSLNTEDSTLNIEGSGAMSSSSWLQYSSFIKYVSLPNGLTSIVETAFYECTELISVNIPNTVSSIGYWAFYKCSSLTSIDIPNSVTSIGFSAFRSCSSLTSANIPTGIVGIPDEMFAVCSLLSEIIIPDNITTIGSNAFAHCYNLTSIEIPNTVTNIGDYAFYDCSGLKSITMGNNVTGIGKFAFHGCSGLTSIELPKSVTSIGSYAFAECSDLTSIDIPYNITSIETRTFQNCSGLTSITIPNRVTSIGLRAFYGCQKMKSVIIGNSVTSIGKEAFTGCSALGTLTVLASIPPSGGDESGINPIMCDLYVRSEYIADYKFTTWWDSFFSYDAASVVFHSVTFKDWDNNILKETEVENGEDAVAPDDPTREGYSFIGWDKDFTYITKSMTVTAQYNINSYCVKFFDWDNTLLKTDCVDWNTAATAPTNPSRSGFEFIGWDKDYSAVKSDLEVYAQYEQGEPIKYSVSFTNKEGEEIFNSEATLKVPAAPEITGFTFIKWLVVSGDLEDGIILQAVYTANTPTSAPEVVTNPSNPAQKLIRNGNVYILTDSKTYTVTGQEVR